MSPRSLFTVLILMACGGDRKPAQEVINVQVDAGPSTPIVIAATAKPVFDPDRPRPTDGAAAPTFSLRSYTGGRCQLAQGKVTVVHFWATWCAPCERSFPELQALSNRLRGSGVEVVAISVDDEESGVASFARGHGAKFAVGWDDGHKLAESYKVQTMPSTFIVDRDGMIRHIHQGYSDGDDASIEREVKALF